MTYPPNRVDDKLPLLYVFFVLLGRAARVWVGQPTERKHTTRGAELFWMWTIFPF